MPKRNPARRLDNFNCTVKISVLAVRAVCNKIGSDWRVAETLRQWSEKGISPTGRILNDQPQTQEYK